MPKQGSVAQLRQEVVGFRAEGLSFSQIARRLAISKSYALKLTQPSRSATPETSASTALTVRDRKFAAGLLEGKSHSQAAVDAGVAPAAASRILEQLKAAGFKELDSLTVYESIVKQHESEPAIDIAAEE
jgi:transposase